MQAPLTKTVNLPKIVTSHTVYIEYKLDKYNVSCYTAVIFNTDTNLISSMALQSINTTAM